MLKLYELALSPNNTKVRMALRWKAIPFETIAVDPRDRRLVLAVSGQEGTPVIEDRGIALPESEAILHYLDANYPDAPRLYPRALADRRACDAWKDELDDKVARHWMPVFFHAIGRRPDLDEAARSAYAEALRWLDREVAGKAHVRGEDRPICDLRVAEWATYAFPGAGLLQRAPLFARVRDLFALDPADYPELVRFIAPWNERLG